MGRSSVLLIDASEHLDERGLAGTVLPHEGVDLAGAQGKVYLRQRTHPGEIFINLPHFQ